MFIASQIILAISSTLYGTSMLVKNKSLLFFIQIISSVLYATSLCLLFAWVGFIVSVFDTIRVFIFYIIEKRNGGKKAKIITSCILFCICIICAIFTWEALYSILPLLGSVVFIISLAISRLLIIKFATLFVATTSTLYLLLLGSYLGAFFECIAIIIGLVGVIKALINLKQHKETTLASD